MRAVLPKEKLVPLLQRLGRGMDVVAPVKSGKSTAFATWRGQDLQLTENPLYSPLEYLLPAREVLFRYIQDSGRYSFEQAPALPRLIFGIRSCDLRAVAILDKIFGSLPEDRNYLEKKGSTLLIALNCRSPGESCSCAQMGCGPECSDSCDLQLTELGEVYLVETGSPAGILILNELSELFQPAEETHLLQKRQLMQEAKAAVLSGKGRFPAEIAQTVRDADWESLEKQCLSCGGCSFVCPVCHCFSTYDLGVPDGERIRCRDSCILSGFSRMAGGSNPRKRLAERLQNWYLDKFQYLPERTGHPGCVGCGRCSRVCLASFDRWTLEARL